MTARWTATDLARALGQFPPTAEQAAVIEAPLEPMLVIAGAGSGKTETMAAKVVHLVANRLVAPGEILGLTFTRKAAAELSERIRQRLKAIAGVDGGIDLSTPPRIATYNSYAAGIVRDHGLRIGVDPEAVLISDAGRFQLAERIVNAWEGDLETDLAASSITGAVLSLAGEVSEHGLTTGDVRRFHERLIAELESKSPEGRSKKPRADTRGFIERMRARVRLMDLLDAFAAAKKERGVVDFGDQVRFAANLATRVPAVGRMERQAYRVVLLDEYQDTSIAQVQLLSALFGQGSGHPVTAVGDPNQAIYGWRGAAAGTLLDFPEHFRIGSRPAHVTTLSTAWRNSTQILAAANTIAGPLRAEGNLDVPQLRARDQAPPGQVRMFYAQTLEEETAHIVTHLHALGWPGPDPAQTAILVRARRLFAPISRALTDAGIPHQVVGLGGLLSTPEVGDLWAALAVVHDPSRSDTLMRLLTGPRMRIGPQDMFVLDAWSKELVRNRTQTPAADNPEEVEAASVVEALGHLPPEHYAPRGAAGPLTRPARRRLERLADQLRRIRSFAHLPLPDLVATAEQTLGLDIDVLANRPAATARDNLDAFASVAATFTSGVDGADLGAFLAWLEKAETHERGLEAGEVEPDPGAVQLMTIHAAKGLEWDAVVVAGMSEGIFPVTAPSKDGVRYSNGWLTAADELPYELRGDAANLPSYDHEQADTHAEMKQVNEEFRALEGARELREERRLAYVALTRARSDLLLTGSFWTPGRTKAFTPSIFLTEAARAEPGHPGVDPEPEVPDNPLTGDLPPTPWPAPDPAPLPDPTPAPNPSPLPDPTVAGWEALARLLLAEREAETPGAELSIEHLSASRVVAAARDREEFVRNQQRPIPQEPSERARRGTRFHAWVEQHFHAPALVDWDLLPGADDEDEEGDLVELSQAFLASPWARRTPIALEADVETTIGEVRVRSRIDAVFLEEDGTYHVVDWKTGRAPTDQQEEQVRMVQLLLYRLGWARARSVPVEQVRASFYYVAQDLTIPAPPLTEEEILAQVTRHLQ